jgi:hypothetical protein
MQSRLASSISRLPVRMWTLRGFFHTRVLILSWESLVPAAEATFGDMDAHRKDRERNWKDTNVRSDMPAVAD